MRFIIIILLLFHVSSANSQKINKIEGTWKIVGFGDEELFFDLTKDSILISQSNEKAREMMDSIQKPLIAGIPMGQYIFSKDGRLVQYSGNKIDGEGTYKINSQQQLVHFTGKRNNLPIKENFKYRFEGIFLYLTQIRDETSLTYKLERLK